MTQTVRFYPSHLTKGLLASVASLIFARIAIREFSLICTDTYPDPKTLKP